MSTHHPEMHLGRRSSFTKTFEAEHNYKNLRALWDTFFSIGYLFHLSDCYFSERVFEFLLAFRHLGLHHSMAAYTR